MTTHGFNVVEYYQLGKLGMLNKRTELLEGIITDMEPISPFHASVGDTLAGQFFAQAQSRYLVRVHQPIDLGSHSLPQPDLVLCRSARYRDRHPSPPDVFLLIEISDTSLDVDLGQKLNLYKASSIPEYWVLDLSAQCVHRFCAPDYEHQSVAEHISPVSWPDIKIDLGGLFQ
jgi:Uma2 family endonuclease